MTLGEIKLSETMKITIPSMNNTHHNNAQHNKTQPYNNNYDSQHTENQQNNINKLPSIINTQHDNIVRNQTQHKNKDFEQNNTKLSMTALGMITTSI